MTPAQKRGAELFSQSSDYHRINLILKKNALEYEQANVAKQMDLAKEIALKHQTEITEAKTRYEASHNSNP